MQRKSSKESGGGAKPPLSYSSKHEGILVMILITLSGGLQDAYTYLIRDHVFANAQTGNIVLLMVSLFDGNFQKAGSYLIPILSFALGIAAAHTLSMKWKCRLLSWRQFIILLEFLLLIAVGFIPLSLSQYANALVSFSCAMQVQSFRRFHGRAYASTMCIGNLRSGMESLSIYCNTKNKDAIIDALHYFGVILTFGIGAGIGGVLSSAYGVQAIWASPLLLIIAFTVMKETGNSAKHSQMAG